MIEAMGAALSGLRAYIDRTRTTANNIANLNTPGFKASRVNQSSIQGGLGVRPVSIQSLASQGSVFTTGSPLDMAISGDGFFVVRDPAGGTGYTRSGAFHMDSEGRLADANGNIAQGYSMAAGAVGAPTDIALGGTQSAPGQTTAFRMGLNLSASAQAGDTFNTTFNAYNAEGEAVPVTYTFTKQAGANNWDYQAAGPAGTSVSGPGSAGTLSFDGSGALVSPLADQALTISGFPSGAADLSLTWSFTDAATGTRYNDITGYASGSSVNTIVQDGYGAGALRGFSIDSSGVVSGVYDNGETQPLYQLQMANFNDPGGLSQLGGGMFGETAQSGQPIYGAAGTGGFGTVMGGLLEMSNVDLSEQMVNLIQNKHGFAAQIKAIQAADEMMGSILDIKA